MKTFRFKSGKLKLAVFAGIFMGSFLGKYIHANYSFVFSSGTAKVLEALPAVIKQGFIANSNELNKLIATTQQIQDNQGNANLLKENRQKISEIYMAMSRSLLTNINVIEDIDMKPLIQELSLGLQSSAQNAKKNGSVLSEFHPQNMNFWMLGVSEMTNAMSSISRTQLISRCIELNQKVAAAKKNKENSDYQQIVRLYGQISVILSQDLHSIQLNNPRMASIARTLIKQSQALSIQPLVIETAIEFHPENEHH
jgi:hypothetical protein